MGIDEWTSWDSSKADPIGDIQRMVARVFERGNRPAWCCPIDGHLMAFGRLRCVVCGERIRDELTDDEVWE